MDRFTARDLPSLEGKTAVVTGANSGLGLETSRLLALAGATVVMTARSEAKFEEAARSLPTWDSGRLRFAELDLGDLSSVRKAAEQIAGDYPVIDILVNNAGVMMSPRATTADGYDLQLGTNHLGHFALTGLLLGPILAAPEGRVVTVSSGAHHMGRMDFDDLHWRQGRYDTNQAYGRSKLANLLFALELNRRLQAAKTNAISVAAHPGYTATNLQTAGVSMEGGGLYQLAMRQVMKLSNRVIASHVTEGVMPQVYAAVADIPGGTYWGPQGFQEGRGPVGPARINPKARNEADARRLWEVSVAETGVDYSALDLAG